VTCVNTILNFKLPENHKKNTFFAASHIESDNVVPLPSTDISPPPPKETPSNYLKINFSFSYEGM
jgi:hypothetical protein